MPTRLSTTPCWRAGGATAWWPSTDRFCACKENAALGSHFGWIKSHALELFFSRLPAPEILTRLTRFMRSALVAKRPGRKVPRHPPPTRQAVTHLRYKRKHVF